MGRYNGALLCACLAIACSLASAGHFSLQSTKALLDNEREHFKAWVTHYGKVYQEGTEEFEQRLALWSDNVRHLVSQQTSLLGSSGEANSNIKINGLMDLHDDEFRQSYLGYRRLTPHFGEDGYRKQNLTFRYRYVVPAEEVNWLSKDIMGPVKDQHVNGSKCGCCWTFAVTGVVEAINTMATGKKEAVSEQQLIDCDRYSPYWDLGCQGGDFGGGIKYIIDNGGIALESEYPYLAKDAQCQRKVEKDTVVTVDAFEDVPGGNETALMQAVTMHPVAVGLCVGPWIKEWRAYTGGILRVPENCEDPQDHALVVVGYGVEENGDKYWLIKNSWSTRWGMEGYMKLDRGMPGNGSLGLAATPGYPIKISANPHHVHPSSEVSLTEHLGSWGRKAIQGFAS